MFSIHSVYSDRELVFSTRKGEYFDAEIKGNELSARVTVWEYEDEDGLDTLFQKLARIKTPWQDTLKWESLEGELSLSVTCSTLGQVTFLVKLRAYP